MNTSPRILRHAVIGLAIGAFALPAIASAQPAPVKVKLTEMKVTPSVTNVKAGKVSFAVDNTGGTTHELVVIKTTLKASKLPVKNGRASEKGSVGETGDLAAHKTKTVTLMLKPGHYALICNIPGHYQAGMHADLTVTA